MDEVQVIDDPAAAGATLDPIRSALLGLLAKEAGSASTLAPAVGLTRQKVNYHLRKLETHGLIELVEERKRGNFTERVMRATAESFVISPAALPAVAPDPARSPDQLSARWMLALGARLVREIGELITRAAAARQPLATFAIDSEIRFASARDRAEFARELSASIEQLVDRYHAADAPGGRLHRFVLALHPSITRPAEGEPSATQNSPTGITPATTPKELQS
jgi:DNA-binding transcriptional ArsR family regulator